MHLVQLALAQGCLLFQRVQQSYGNATDTKDATYANIRDENFSQLRTTRTSSCSRSNLHHRLFRP